MVAPVGINIANSRIQGIFKDLMHYWKNAFPKFEKFNSILAHQLSPSNVRNGKYAWKNPPGGVEIWDQARGRIRTVIDDVQSDVSFVPYQMVIDVNLRDLRHDQLGDTRTHIETCVNRFGQLLQILTSEYLNGAAVKNITLKKAFDGADIYSATDGNGANRFSVSGGNIESGFSRTVEGFTQKLYAVQSRFLAFKAPGTSEIIYDQNDVDFGKFFVVVPRTMNEIVHRVANVEYLRSDTSNNVSEGNFFATKGKFDYWVNNLLTDENSFFVFLKNPSWKPFVYRQESDVRTIWADMQNSDIARNNNVGGFYCDQEVGVGVGANWSTIKVAA